jgi:Flp pilus assembly pilin Flp
MENRRGNRKARVKRSEGGAGSVEYALVLGGLVLAFVAGVVVLVTLLDPSLSLRIL